MGVGCWPTKTGLVAAPSSFSPGHVVVAQRVERESEKLGVGGANPSSDTIITEY